MIPNAVPSLNNVSEIAVNHRTIMAIRDGALYAWGQNNNGQIGDNTRTNRTAPVRVHNDSGDGLLSDIILASTGQLFSAAVRADGTVYTWGNNPNGELGNDTTTRSDRPINISMPHIYVNPREVVLNGVNDTAVINPSIRTGFNLLVDGMDTEGFKFTMIDESIARIVGAER